MSKKHVAVCDQCGDEGSLRESYGPDEMPEGWIMTVVVRHDRSKEPERADFCCWNCVAAYGEAYRA